MFLGNKKNWCFITFFLIGLTTQAQEVERCSYSHRTTVPSISNQEAENKFSQGIAAYMSFADKREFLKPVSKDLISISRAHGATSKLIDLKEASSCQEMSGFGFAMTESTVINIKSLEPRLRNDAMMTLFDRTVGAGFNYLIVPLTSTDFNDPDLGDFSVCDCKDGDSSKAGCFNPSRLTSTLEILKQAQAINPQLKLMLKPWTVPPHMKASGSVKNSNPYFGGKFDASWTSMYAKCLAQSVKYFEKNGLKVKSVAAQNEPGLDLPYPSTVMDDQDHAKLLNDLSKRLRAQGSKAQLIVRADNFISSPSVQSVLSKLDDRENRPGFAAHCYSNDPQTPKMLLKDGSTRFCSTKKNRQLEYLMGECTATAHPDFNGDFNWWMDNRVMGDVDLGATAVLGWNGLLDENYGPKNNGCAQCRGLLSVDSVAGSREILRNPEYYAIAHISMFVQPGALRLILDNGQLAFKNPDGSTVILLKNSSNQNNTYAFATPACRVVNIDVPAGSTMTVRLPQEN